MTSLVILIFGSLILYQGIMLRRANETIAELENGYSPQAGVYRLTVTPGAFQRAMEAIDNRPTVDDIIDAELHGYRPPLSRGHYSQGGIRPHLCVCGKPLAEHQ